MKEVNFQELIMQLSAWSFKASAFLKYKYF